MPLEPCELISSTTPFIHRRAHEWYSADHGELLYRNDGFIEEEHHLIEPLCRAGIFFSASGAKRLRWMVSKRQGRCGWLI